MARSAKHGDGGEDGIAPGRERGEWKGGRRETIFPWAAEELIAKKSDKAAGVGREGN